MAYNSIQMNRLAQYVYEEFNRAEGLSLDIEMTAKPALVEALTRAITRLERV